MVSRIDIGPDGGPYVEIDEDAGDLVIRVPSNTVDFDSNDLLNAVLQNATMDGGSLDGVSLASALDANNQDLNSVGTASVTALEANDATINSRDANLFLAASQEGYRIESGTENLTGAIGASDNTWDTRERKTVTVTFNQAFSSPPNVTVSRNLLSGEVLGVSDTTTTGFDMRIANYGTTDLSGISEPTEWIAIGEQ